MRNILFRAKRIDNDEWAYGYHIKTHDYLDNREIHLIVGIDSTSFPTNEITDTNEIDPETLGRYTELNDKHGIKIFEGDIVLKRTYQGKKPFPVAYHDGMFHCGWGGGSSTATHGYTLADKQIEVIGNVYDNLGLLEVNNNG